MKKKKEKKLKKFLNNIKFVWKYSKGCRKIFVIAFIFGFFEVGFTILFPILGANEILYLTNNELEKLFYVGLMLLTIRFSSHLFYMVMYYFRSKGYRILLSSIQVDVGKNILTLQNKCLDENGSGVFIQRINDDSTKFAEIFSRLETVFSSIFNDVGIYITVFILNKIIFLFLIIRLIIVYLLEKRRTNLSIRDEKEIRTFSEKVTGFIGELVRGSIVKKILFLNLKIKFILLMIKKDYKTLEIKKDIFL